MKKKICLDIFIDGELATHYCDGPRAFILQELKAHLGDFFQGQKKRPNEGIYKIHIEWQSTARTEG